MQQQTQSNPSSCPVLFIPHGGGPMPLLGEPGHLALVQFLTDLGQSIKKPSAIVLISAHWEQARATITHSASPALLYDYVGFPPASYAITYPALGDPILAERVFQLLQQHGISAHLDQKRGFDHGLFVPLKLLFPDASIPCVQLSLLSHLQPAAHIAMGRALSNLRKDNVMIIGSGFSFHNMSRFFSADPEDDVKNQAFHAWLIDSCTNPALTEIEREHRLLNWQLAPFARFCQPREEHLLPLHVCYGAANSPATCIFNDKVFGKQACGFLW